jgi:GDP-L-fucose synthase
MGKLSFDINKSDGEKRKLIEVSRLSNMGWEYSTESEGGLKETHDWCSSEEGE